MYIGLLIFISLLLFLLQMLLLVKTKKAALRMLPAGLLLLEVFSAVLIYAGVFGGSEGFIAANELLGIVMLLASAAFAGAILAAWIVWGLYMILKN